MVVSSMNPEVYGMVDFWMLDLRRFAEMMERTVEYRE
jgi:hypothetical protein